MSLIFNSPKAKDFKKYLIIAGALFALGIFVILTSVFLFDQKLLETQAASIHKIRGWGWSENAGWISMNCYNDYDNNGVFENCCPGGNPGNCPYGLAGGDYGVHYDKEGDKTLSGWAWSENIGWICFGKTCQNVCLGGSNDGNSCTIDANCPAGVCGGQPPHGLPVSWACVGNPGWLCQGGTEPGTSCFQDADCAGGGLCRFSCGGDNGENFVDTGSCIRSSHLKAHWKMNSVVTGTTADDSDNGNTGTLMFINTPPIQVQGKFGNALEFDGAEDYVEAADSASLSVTGNLTVEAWVKRGLIGDGEQTVVGKWDESTNRSYRLWFNVDNRLNFTVSDGTNTATVTQKDGVCLGLNTETTQCLTDNDCAAGEVCKNAPITDIKKWHHLAGKYVADVVGTNSNEKTLQLFIDGSRVPTYAVSGTIPDSLTDQGEKLYIGAKKGSSIINTYFKGIIDDVSVWSCQNVGKILGRNDKEIWNDAKIELDGWARVISLGDRGWLKLRGFTKDGRVWGSSLHDYTTFYTFNGYLANRWVDESLDTNGLVAFWKMNEPSWTINTQVNDDSGNGNHGVASSGATTTEEGIFNRAGDFDGVNDYVNLPNADVYDFAQDVDFTISLWANRHGVTSVGYPKFFGHGATGSTTTGYAFGINGDDDLIFYLCNGTNRGYTIYNNVFTSLNVWHHVVVAADRDGNATLYVDGSQVGTPWNILTYNVALTSSVNVIGAWTTTSSFFNGLIDNVAIYNRALEPDEIEEIYEKRIPHCVGWDEYDHEYDEPPAPLAFDSLIIDNTQGCEQLSLQWALAPWAESYTYERCDNASQSDCDSCSYTQRSVLADSCDETGCSLSDTSLSSNEGYCYKIQAHNGTGSTWATDNPPVSPIPYWKSTTLCSPEEVASNTATCGRIVVNWAKGDDVDGYNIYRSLTESGSSSCEDLTYAGCELTGHLAEALDYDADNDATNDLVAQWKMNEASWSGESEEVKDSSAQTPLNNGTAFGGVSTTAGGKFDRAGDFNGDNDYIDCGDNPSLDLGLAGDSFTLEAWIKPDESSPSTYGAVIAKDSYSFNSDRNYWFGQKISSSGIYFGTRNQADTNYASWTTNAGLTIDRWNHIAVVWDRTNNNVVLYIDGKVKNWDVSGGTPFDIPPAYDTNASIGMSGDINSYPYSGLIDNVAIYNVAKTAEQIKIDYEAGVNSNCESDQCGLAYVCDDATLPHNKCGAANTCCYTDSRIIPYINYYYRVTGTGESGETPASETVGPDRTVCFPPVEEEEE